VNSISRLAVGDRVHLVGIGGIGMTALTQYLLTHGYVVTGSDRMEGEALDVLRSAGAEVTVGHAAVNVGDARLVIVTAAASSDNPEVMEARARDIPVVTRAQVLGEVIAGNQSIAVSGTHGKSTVSALVAHLLRSAGFGVTLLGGAYVRTEGSETIGPSWSTGDDWIVVEADEYDRSFHQLHPTFAVITGIEFDHPDCYADIDDTVTAFSRFAGQVGSGIAETP